MALIEVKKVLDDLKAEELKNTVKEGGINNEVFYEEQIKPNVEKALKAAVAGDYDTLVSLFTKKQQLEYLSMEQNTRNDVANAMKLIQCLSTKGTLTISPYWVHYESSRIFADKDLNKVYKDATLMNTGITGFVSLSKDKDVRISNPGVEFDFVIDKGTFALRAITTWENQDLGCKRN